MSGIWQPDLTTGHARGVTVARMPAGQRATKDSQPQGGDQPTSRWQTGQVVKDEYLLALDPQTPDGAYVVEVGMYLGATGKRLTLLAEAGHAQDNRIVLTQIRVVGR